MHPSEQPTTSVRVVVFDERGERHESSAHLFYEPGPRHCPHCAREINVAIPAPGVCKHEKKPT